MNDIGNESLVIVRMYIFIITTVICVAGIILSSFSAFVYIKMPLPNATNTYLTILCFSDLCHLLLGLSRSICNLIDIFTTSVPPGDQFMINYFHLIMLSLLRNFSICLHCIICAERFLAVVFPFRTRLIRLFNNPKKCLLLLCVINGLYAVPFCVKLRSSKSLNRDPVTYLPQVNFSSFYSEHKSFFQVYEFTISIILVYIPFIMTIVFTLYTAGTIRNSLKSRGTLRMWTRRAEYVKQRQQVTRIVIASSLMFVMLAFPTTTIKFVSIVVPDTFSRPGTHKNMFMMFVLLGFVSDLIGCTVNFCFYYNMSKSFRQTFKATICKCNSYKNEAFQSMKRLCEGLHGTERFEMTDRNFSTQS